MRILKNRWFDKFARKQGIGAAALRNAVVRAEQGLIDADLGGGVIKQRVAREGQGKSGGYRTIILFRSGRLAVFAFGFAKSDQANLAERDLADLRKLAALLFASTDQELDRAVATGWYVELRDGQDL